MGGLQWGEGELALSPIHATNDHVGCWRRVGAAMNSDAKNKLTVALGLIGALFGAGYAHNEFGQDTAIGGAVIGAILGAVAAHIIWVAVVFALGVVLILVELSGALVVHEARRQFVSAVTQPDRDAPPPLASSPSQNAIQRPSAQTPANARTAPAVPRGSPVFEESDPLAASSGQNAPNWIPFATSTRADFPVDLYANMFRSGAQYGLYADAGTDRVALTYVAGAAADVRRWVYFVDFHSLAGQLPDGRYVGLPMELHPEIERRLMQSRTLHIMEMRNGSPVGSRPARVDIEDVAG